MLFKDTIEKINDEIIHCQRCPRLTTWRNEVARQKRKAFLDWDYWGKPVPGFGDNQAQVFILGLAPGAHGSNRTGRMFTGDASGDFLYPALNKAGFASQPGSVHLSDGLRLSNIFISAVCRCAPPGNKPNIDEMKECHPFLEREIHLIKPKVIVALGRIAYERILKLFDLRKEQFRFKHGSIHQIGKNLNLVCSYHPSRQNTQTGRLTREMFDQIWSDVNNLLIG